MKIFIIEARKVVEITELELLHLIAAGVLVRCHSAHDVEGDIFHLYPGKTWADVDKHKG